MRYHLKMQKRPPRYGVTIGRTREVRGSDALEFLAVAACVLSVLLVAMAYGFHQKRMAAITEPLSLASGGPESGLIVYRSLYGSWPSSLPNEIFRENGIGLFVQTLRLRHYGAITAKITFPDKTEPYFPGWKVVRKTSGLLSFRPVIAGAEGYGAVLFLCGYASPPRGVPAPRSVNETTLNEDDLPPDCRRDGK